MGSVLQITHYGIFNTDTVADYESAQGFRLKGVRLKDVG